MRFVILFLGVLLLNTVPVFAAKGKLKKQKEQIKKDIYFLASDSLEGRRTGTPGEEIAAFYIAGRLQNMNVAPYGNSYFQNWQTADGKIIDSTVQTLQIDGIEIPLENYAILPCGANETVDEYVMQQVKEQGTIELIPISKISTKNLNNPHDDAMTLYEEVIKKSESAMAKAVILYNDIDSSYDYTYNGKTKSTYNCTVPVAFLHYTTYKKYIAPALKNEWISIKLTTAVIDKIVEGINIVGYINNKAATTVVIGAHYDHLGYGEDHNSLHTGEPAIHNGADDNASGVAALLALAEMLKTKKFTNNNYVLAAFSGEELGLFGSKKFVKRNTGIIDSLNYMINMDMVGRYDAAKKAMTIGGVGTSPAFIPSIEKSKKFFTPKYDSAGVGPSDHTSFYMEDKPVLFFFTGLHTDYHKPSDDAEKVNIDGEANIINYIYSLIGLLDKQGKLPFTKTKEPKMEAVAFKVTLGIMPDYTFSGAGVHADGVTDGKPAKLAGILAGDIILKIGEYATADMTAYMKALAKHKKGDEVNVVLLRGKDEVVVKVKF
jgi:aminopeptidase YwaD